MYIHVCTNTYGCHKCIYIYIYIYVCVHRKREREKDEKRKEHEIERERDPPTSPRGRARQITAEILQYLPACRLLLAMPSIPSSPSSCWLNLPRLQSAGSPIALS